MPSLLTLPAELRDQIIDLVICTRTEPPKDAFTDDNPRRPSSTNPNLMYPALAPYEVYSGYGLLLSCRQLNAETQDRIKSLDLPAEIDVMVVNRRDLWPTWVSIPSRACKTLEVTFRLGDSQEQFSDHLFCHFGIQHDGHVPSDHSTVLDLIKRVLDMCISSPSNERNTFTTSPSDTRPTFIPFNPPPHLQLPFLKINVSAPEGIFNNGTAPFVARNESADLTAYDNIHLLRCRKSFMSILKRVEVRWRLLGQQPGTLRKAVAWFILSGINRGVTKIDDMEAGYILQFPNGVRVGRARVFIDGEKEAGLGDLC
ncbi:hypothetical protein BDV96DRAFT_582086 [Lophiotrema nucula]|uniref:Uncharacterized protein n=1 Tax=Lophiotrema nucula TaxID=690887 RepID=A0A6A5YX23_9PLEO|nr:hypothetical protein BDV96DRAFT_582086 [Lophiotrema nucula]